MRVSHTIPAGACVRTGPTLADAPTRAQWRDAVMADGRLRTNDVFVAVIMADFWKTDSTEPIWAAVEVVMARTRLSRAAVFKAMKHLREVGYLWQVEAARHNRSPRWVPRIAKAEQSPTETESSTWETNLSLTNTRDHTKSSCSPDIGSEDLDRESPPDFGFSPTPATTREQADYRVLAGYMANHPPASVAKVYEWMREGLEPKHDKRVKPVRFPGAWAMRNHAKPTTQEGISEWQGYFIRIFLKDGVNQPPRVDFGKPRAA